MSTVKVVEISFKADSEESLDPLHELITTLEQVGAEANIKVGDANITRVVKKIEKINKALAMPYNLRVETDYGFILDSGSGYGDIEFVEYDWASYMAVQDDDAESVIKKYRSKLDRILSEEKWVKSISLLKENEVSVTFSLNKEMNEIERSHESVNL